MVLTYPQIRDCSEPGRISIKPINIDDVDVMNLGLGRSIYSPEQLEEFMRFQESQGTRRAYLADSAERAYNSRVGGEWGSGLTGAATDSLIDAVGNQLVPMYRVIGPTAAVALLILFLIGVIRMLARKSKPRIGRSTPARRNSQEKEEPPNLRGTRRVPQDGMTRPLAAARRGPEGGAEET